MGDITNDQLERHLKRWSIKANVIAVVSAIIMALSFGYGFYYNTNAQLQQNTSDIKEIKVDVEEINDKVTDNSVFKGSSQAELNALKDQVKRIEDKQDKMLDMMAEYFARRDN